MSRQPVRESDLRSLERPRLYTIFAPLDANEPLPRELVLAGRRHRSIGRWELAGALWLPALALILTFGGSVRVPPLVALGMIGLTFAGLVAFAVTGRK